MGGSIPPPFHSQRAHDCSLGIFLLNLWGLMVRMGYLRRFVLRLLSAGISRRVIWLNCTDVSDEPAASISVDDRRISQKTTLNMWVALVRGLMNDGMGGGRSCRPRGWFPAWAVVYPILVFSQILGRCTLSVSCAVETAVIYRSGGMQQIMEFCWQMLHADWPDAPHRGILFPNVSYW